LVLLGLGIADLRNAVQVHAATALAKAIGGQALSCAAQDGLECMCTPAKEQEGSKECETGCQEPCPPRGRHLCRRADPRAGEQHAGGWQDLLPCSYCCARRIAQSHERLAAAAVEQLSTGFLRDRPKQKSGRLSSSQQRG
jgi:hypothetical protein